MRCGSILISPAFAAAAHEADRVLGIVVSLFVEYREDHAAPDNDVL
jgi:hypothetical protein